MRLSEMLRPEHVIAPLQADTFRAAVRELLQRLVDTGALLHPERVEKLTTEDRVRDVVHVGDRILLPHLRTDAVGGLVVAIGVSQRPLKSVGVAAEPTEQIVVLVLAPPSAATLYLQTVAGLARALRSEGVVDRILAARSPEEIVEIPEIRNLSVQPRLAVRDIMTQRVHRVFPDTPVSELLELLARHELKAVPVVGEKREVLGIVTDRDLLRFLLPHVVQAGTGEPQELKTQERSLQDTPVREIMSRSVMCISEDQSLAELASIMVNKDVERLPVVSEGKLTGFLTRSDILRKLFGK
jgi:CBS domain-containing protein